MSGDSVQFLFWLKPEHGPAFVQDLTDKLKINLAAQGKLFSSQTRILSDRVILVDLEAPPKDIYFEIWIANNAEYLRQYDDRLLWISYKVEYGSLSLENIREFVSAIKVCAGILKTPGAGFDETEKSDRNLIHSLEHGYVVIAYNCAIKNQKSTLRLLRLGSG